MIATTTQLNTAGPALAALEGVHAMTDVTGFGLAGHALEVARGSASVVAIDWAAVPLIDGVRELAQAGFVTGASQRNWAAYGQDVLLADPSDVVTRQLLCDPQTSGGLLVSCTPDALDTVLATFHAHGFDQARCIGDVLAGPQAQLQVR
jgi:selenide,water dikinase